MLAGGGVRIRVLHFRGGVADSIRLVAGHSNLGCAPGGVAGTRSQQVAATLAALIIPRFSSMRRRALGNAFAGRGKCRAPIDWRGPRAAAPSDPLDARLVVAPWSPNQSGPHRVTCRGRECATGAITPSEFRGLPAPTLPTVQTARPPRYQGTMPKGPEWLPAKWLLDEGARERKVRAYLPAGATECTVRVVPASVPLTTARLPARRFSVASAVLSVVARV